jgi:LacI family transcriptional regulator
MMAIVVATSAGSRRRPTMVDVARLAGVSATTVSFVINGRADGSVGADTAQRVLDAVDQLGYRPNVAAQTLRTRRTRTIGFVTDEIAVRPPAGQTVAGAHDAALRHGSLLLIVHATRDPDSLHAALRQLHDRQVDAVVYALVGTASLELPPASRQTPMVLVNGFAEGVPCIVPDEYTGGGAATQALIDAGHHRLAYLTGWPDSWATVQRLAGFRAAVQAAGIPARSTTVLPGDFEVGSGYDLTRRLLARRHRPTAICFGNDVMAIGGYLAIKEAGFAIPGDISVIGYDDHDHFAADLPPPLSTMRLPYYEMGRWAAEQVLDDQVGSLPACTYAPCPPVMRASIAPPNGRAQAGSPRNRA